MPYYQLMTDKTLLVLNDIVGATGTSPLQDTNPDIIKTWYLDPALPLVEYRKVRSQIMAEVDALKGPPGAPPGVQTESNV